MRRLDFFHRDDYNFVSKKNAPRICEAESACQAVLPPVCLKLNSDYIVMLAVLIGGQAAVPLITRSNAPVMAIVRIIIQTIRFMSVTPFRGGFLD